MRAWILKLLGHKCPEPTAPEVVPVSVPAPPGPKVYGVHVEDALARWAERRKRLQK